MQTPEDHNPAHTPASPSVDRGAEFRREMREEIRRFFDRLCDESFARLDRLEASHRAKALRLKSLEERILALETRPPR